MPPLAPAMSTLEVTRRGPPACHSLYTADREMEVRRHVAVLEAERDVALACVRFAGL